MPRAPHMIEHELGSLRETFGSPDARFAGVPTETVIEPSRFADVSTETVTETIVVTGIFPRAHENVVRGSEFRTSEYVFMGSGENAGDHDGLCYGLCPGLC